jgi:Fe-S-cluster containining protein
LAITIITSKSGNGQLLIRNGECNQCEKCCKTLNITVVRDVTLNQHRSIKELELYLGYRGIRLVGENIESNQLFYSIETPCQQLGPENECKVHLNSEAKPLLCSRYPIEPDVNEECIVTNLKILLH